MLNHLLLNILLYKRRKEIKNISLSNESIKKNKLLKLLSSVKKNIEFFKNLNDLDIYSIESFPLQNKEIIQNNFNKIRKGSFNNKIFAKDCTSGSTGESMYFYRDKKLIYKRLANEEYGDNYTGWKMGEPKLIIWGAERDIKQGLVRKIAYSKFFLNTKIVSSFHMTGKDMLEYIRLINTFKPLLIVGYPSTLEFFSNFIMENGGLNHYPKNIISSGETLYSFQREIIENTFHCKLFNRYGCREVGNIAMECKAHNGMHVLDNHIYIEIIDEHGQALQPGELGEIVVTDLDNYVFPFIRYRIGDLGVLSNEKCKCGKDTIMLKNVQGRTFDLIVGINGNRVPGNFFTTALRYRVKGVKKFRIIQNSFEQIDVKIVKDTGYKEIDKEAIENLFKEKLGIETQVNISIVDSIETTPTGKHRFIISKVSPFVK